MMGYPVNICQRERVQVLTQFTLSISTVRGPLLVLLPALT